MCFIDNEAVLKALFKAKDDDLTFAKAIEIATQIEDAAKCAKDTMGHSDEHDVQKVNKRSFKPKFKTKRDFPNRVCGRCGKSHRGKECRYETATCAFYKRIGHLEKICLSKKRQSVTIIISSQKLTKCF